MSDFEPAFPILDTTSSGVISLRNGGMSLRDYFAGQALAGIASLDPETLVQRGLDHQGIIANSCYLLADAMLAARQEHDEP